MGKRGSIFFSVFIVILFFLSPAYADGFSDEVRKVTYYAEQYEAGNINYAQLIVYISSLQQSANRIFDGNSSRAVQLNSLLGPATEETYSVWNQDEQREVQLEKPLPGWRKLLFDGNKLQLWLGAWPNVRGNNTEKVFYNLHVDIQFKHRRDIEDIGNKVDHVTALARDLKEGDSSRFNELVKESGAVERTLGRYLNNNPAQCSAIMEKYIGSVRDTQDIVAREITLKSGAYGSAKVRLEYCETCEDSWININAYREYRGRYRDEDKVEEEQGNYNSLNEGKLRTELKKSLQAFADNDGSEDDQLIRQRISLINNALNEKRNSVWRNVEQEFNEKQNSLSDEQRKNYDWGAERKSREEKAQTLRKEQYLDLISFYRELFTEYPVKEIRFKQTNYEKRLLSTFKEIKPEMCSNGIDDNENSFVDCKDSECHGQPCSLNDGNETKQGFCNKGVCEARKEERKCPTSFGNISCDGKVVFKGKDNNGCPFEPLCLPKGETCAQNSDCAQPLCGSSECIAGICTVNNLSECRQKECVDGDQKTQQCIAGDVTIEICQESVWRKTNASCLQNASEQIRNDTEEFLGNECSAKQDCSGDMSVCSNGKCVVLPSIAPEPTVTVPENTSANEPEQDTANEEENSDETTSEGQATNIQGESEETKSASAESPPVLTGITLTIRKIMGYIIRGDGENATSDGNGNGTIRTEYNRSMEKDNETASIYNDTAQGNQSARSNDTAQGMQNDTAPHSENLNERNMTRAQGDESPRMEKQPRQVEDGGFGIYGSCKVSQEKSEGYLSFNGWGKEFEKYQKAKERYYRGDNKDWCKEELASLLAQRDELELSLNEDFARWFFESHVANAADRWEDANSGIYEVYWKDVELSKRIAESMRCIGLQELPEHHLISFNYTTSYGGLTFWEEIKVAVIDEHSAALPVISPYMKVWLLPPKEFIKGELKKAMREQRFPGPENEESARDADQGPSEEDRAVLKSDEAFMKKFRKITYRYNGTIDASVQLKDGEEIVFNLYVKVNEDDIMRMKPMPPELMPEKDMTINIDFDKIYALVEQQERESQSTRIESPPWDRKRSERKIEDIKDAIKIFFKVQGIISEAEVIPKEAKKDIMSLLKTFLWKMMTSGHDEGQG